VSGASGNNFHSAAKVRNGCRLPPAKKHSAACSTFVGEAGRAAFKKGFLEWKNKDNPEVP
jgi:hypothetical protein